MRPALWHRNKLSVAISTAFSAITRQGSISTLGSITSSNSNSGCLISPYVMMTTTLSTSGYPAVVATSINNSTWAGTIGTPTVLNAVAGGAFISCQLSNGFALTTWSQTGVGYCAVISNGGSGTTLTKNTAVVFNSVAYTTLVNCVALSPTLVLITYTTNADNFHRVVAVSISGTTCTVGTAVQLNSVASGSAASVISALSANTAVIAYGPANQNIVIATVSGTTISLGTGYTPASSPATVYNITGFSLVGSGTFLMTYTTAAVYATAPTGGHGSTRARVMTFTGTTIGEGSSDIVLVTSVGLTIGPAPIWPVGNGQYVYAANYAIEYSGSIDVNLSWAVSAFVMTYSAGTLTLAANNTIGFQTVPVTGSADNNWQWHSLIPLSGTEFVWHSGYIGNSLTPTNIVAWRPFTLS